MTSLPGPHPLPPDLSATSLPVVERDVPWFRLHKQEFGAIYFGRSGVGRFDPPETAPDFGVLYLAFDVHCAFIETFGHSHVGRERYVTLEMLESKRLAVIQFDRPLRLVDLTDSGLARIGADLRLCTGDYAVSRAWSQALYQHADSPDGVLYRSRHDPARQCAAIFSRAEGQCRTSAAGTLADPQRAALLAAILDDYGFGLV